MINIFFFFLRKEIEHQKPPPCCGSLRAGPFPTPLLQQSCGVWKGPAGRDPQPRCWPGSPPGVFSRCPRAWCGLARSAARRSLTARLPWQRGAMTPRGGGCYDTQPGTCSAPPPRPRKCSLLPEVLATGAVGCAAAWRLRSCFGAWVPVPALT